MGRTVRHTVVPRPVLLQSEPAADVPVAQETGRQGKVQGHVLGDQRGQLRVPGTSALPVSPVVPLLILPVVY